MAVCRQNLPLGARSSRIAPSVLVGELFKKFGLFLNTGVRKGRPGNEHCTSYKEIVIDLEVMFFPLDSVVLKPPVGWNHCSKRGTCNLLLN